MVSLMILGMVLGEWVNDLAQVARPEPNTPVQVVALNETSDGSAYIVWVDREVKAHYHAVHTEWVYVIEGEGILTMEGREIQIRPGQQIMIPRGAVHEVKVSGEQAMKVLSIQTPQFHGKDRVFLPESEAKEQP